jgi:flagellar hook assembly protein FlgD
MASVVDGPELEPARLYLEPNIPNPFRPSTEIRYRIPAGPGSFRVTLRVYDTLGRCVRTLVDADRPPGAHAVTWDGRDDCGRKVASGVYFCHIRWSGQTDTLRMVLLR